MRAVIAAFALIAIIAIIGAVLAIIASPSGPGRVALAPPLGLPRLHIVTPRASIPTPRLRVAPQPLPGPNTPVFAVDMNGSGLDLRPIGLLLLVVGTVGIILSLLYSSLWANPRHWSRRRKYSNEGPGDPGYY